ncbi:MAG: hypothetical protein US50_C0016G0005 [Candidatus Nomurabacteria bacterium GW2011_GWB1_37_5]|uniref:Uncharacterized protein n=1 Tax=Candidatus Nomurabacteria bacterium GW2011_GWB1_37_5 TaxID=1618742 RepID=A0A0G0HA09_9BACT|nr:MAG: hypothetical protein US50_C0016G0005 [Candidatus Nomurabacteria bacterium GW2011_GWB1_37_5]
MYLIKQCGSKNLLLRYLIAMPLIWLPLISLIILDIFLELYHRIAFPIYGIPYVKRSQYIQITDREKLPYLTWYEKIGCAYCGYANGWLHYASTIAGRTESYFCAIAHLETRGYIPSEHEKSFVKYGDEAALKKRYFMHDLKYGHDKEPK